MPYGVVVVISGPHAVETADFEVHLRRVEGPGRGVAVLRQQPVLAGELPEISKDLPEFREAQRVQATRTRTGAAPPQQPHDVVLGDVAALEEAVGLAGEHPPALLAGRRPAGEAGHRLAPGLRLVPAPPVRELRHHLEPALLRQVVGAVVALVHQGRFLGIQLDIGDEVLEAGEGVVLDDDRRVPDPVVALDAEPDLVQLDPETPQLHLVVDAADELDGAVGVPVGQVAGPVEPGGPVLPVERVVDEPLRGQVRPVQVSPRELDAADVQLADLAWGQRRAIAVENVELRVVRRRAYRDRLDAVRDGVPVDGEAGGVDGALGRPVQVDQLTARQHVQAAQREGPRKGLPAAEELGERRALPQPLGVQQRLQQGRDALQRGHAVGHDGVDEPFGVAVDAGASHDDRAAARGREDLPLRRVEAHGGLLQDDPVLVDPVDGVQPPHLVDDRAVLDHHPLRPARAAGGVDDVRRVAGVDAGTALPGPFWRCGGLERVRRVQDDYLRSPRRQLGQPCHEVPLGQDDPGPGVLDDVAQPLLGILRGERQVGAAGAQDPPHARHQLDRRLDEHPDAVVGTHAETPQVAGQVRAALRELAVGEALVPVDARRTAGL